MIDPPIPILAFCPLRPPAYAGGLTLWTNHFTFAKVLLPFNQTSIFGCPKALLLRKRLDEPQTFARKKTSCKTPLSPVWFSPGLYCRRGRLARGRIVFSGVLYA